MMEERVPAENLYWDGTTSTNGDMTTRATTCIRTPGTTAS